MNIIYRSFVYDFLYLLADTAIKRENPCKIHVSDVGKVVCTSWGPCCTVCKYLSDTGCTIKCLHCKVYLCSSPGDYHKLRNLLVTIRGIAYKYDLCHMRTTKADVIDRLKTIRYERRME